VTVKALKIGEKYKFQVQMTNPCGQKRMSNTVSITLSEEKQNFIKASVEKCGIKLDYEKNVKLQIMSKNDGLIPVQKCTEKNCFLSMAELMAAPYEREEGDVFTDIVYNGDK